MNASARPLLLSLKPRYANLVFDGLKTAELRRRDLRHMRGRDVFIYVTSPVKKLRGGFRGGEVWTGSPDEVWRVVCKDAGIERDDYDAYYAGREVAYALEITKVWEYAHPVGLSTLKNRFQRFVAPQSWRYVKPEEYRSFRRLKRGGEDAGGILKATSVRQTEAPLPQPSMVLS